MVDSLATAPRVPAWKRLGLKLKYAKDEVQSPVSNPENASASKKRSRPVENHDESTSAQVKKDGTPTKGKSEDKKSKKRKTSQDDAAATSKSKDVIADSTAAEKPSKKDKTQKKSGKSEAKEQNLKASTSKSKPSIPDHAVSTPIKTLKRKKSVSFTPDTKTSDGDQHLVKTWTSSLRQEEPSVPSSGSTEPATSSAVEDANKPSKTELKKAKKEAKRQAKNDAATFTSTAASTAPADGPPFVTYLQQYHMDRANWKFNKVKQGTLFDNMFKIQRLPASYDGALRAYLEGLKGDAVRQRLQEQAREILEKTKDEQQANDADAGSDASSASSSSSSSSSDDSSDSDSDSSSSDSSSDADSDSDSGSPTPSTTTTASSGDKKKALSATKSATLKRSEKITDAANASADRQLLLAQRCRAQMILEVLGPKSVQDMQPAKARKKGEGKKEKVEVESESSDESSVVSSSSSSEESGSEESSSEDDSSGSEDDSSSSSSSSSSEDDSD